MQTYEIGRPVPADYDGPELRLCPLELDRERGLVTFPGPVPSAVRAQILETLRTVDFEAWRQAQRRQRLEETKQRRRELFRHEAQQRIAKVVDGRPETDFHRLVAKELNMMMQVLEQVIDGDRSNVAALKDLKRRIDAIRSAENSASAALDAATTEAEVASIKPAWPE